jgi:hypothetical protein
LYLFSAHARLARVGKQEQDEKGFVLAEAAIESAAVLVNAGAFVEGSVLDWLADGIDNDGDGEVDEGDENVFVSGDFWDGDGIDNDADGATDEVDEKVIRLTCDVTIGWRARRLTGWLRASSTGIPEPAGAANLLDPFASMSASGIAFLVEGRDTGMAGIDPTGPGDPLYGIATTGNPSDALSDLTNPQQGKVRGIGGSPSATSWSADPATFFDTARDEALRDQFTATFYGEDTLDKDALGDWASRRMEFVYATGNQTISGVGDGYGILFVDGDLEISGEYDFRGLLFVRGEMKLSGSCTMRGAVFVGADIVVVHGAPKILYSSEILALLRDRLSTQYVVSAVLEPAQPAPGAPRKAGPVSKASLERM